MQIVCPNCTTTYEIPDAVFGGRARKLRCETCGTQWRAGPPGADGLPAAAPASPPPPVAPARVFGKPADAVAQAEFEQAMDRERQNPSQPEDEAAPDIAAEVGGDAEDPFINLVMAARSRAIEFEPDPPPEPRFRLSGPVLIGGLVVLFVLSVGFLLLHMH